MNNKITEILQGFRPPFYYENFEEFYIKCGFSRTDICKISNRSKNTIKRWELSGAPKEIYLLIYSCAGYFLSEAFYGFRIVNNSMYTGTRITYNYGFTASEIINYSFFNDYSKTLEQKNIKLKELLDIEIKQVRVSACTPANLSLVNSLK